MKESRYNIWVERGDSVYVFNCLSGALLQLPREERSLLQRWLADESGELAPPESTLSMLEGQVLLIGHENELEVLAGRYRASRNDLQRFALTIVTSLGCNFDCPYCFEAKHPSLIKEEVQQALLGLLDDRLPTIRSLHVTWFGGEPLVGKQALLSLSGHFIDRCQQWNVDYEADIITNGYLLNEQTCLQLRAHRVRSAQVSLDGPPPIHDSRRPLIGGKGTFWRIVQNLHHAVEYLDVSVRINVDQNNFNHTEKLLEILAAEGLAGRLTVGLGPVVGYDDGASSPSTTYRSCCFTNSEFARAERKFFALASSYGFARAALPRPIGAPCTAVRTNELVVGSEGELYKCFLSPGNPKEVIGNIRDYQNPNGRLHKWLNHDPFADEECRNCIALPVCMGGCAHHAMDKRLYENRCSTFRHTYQEQILTFIEAAEASGPQQPVEVPVSG